MLRTRSDNIKIIIFIVITINLYANEWNSLLHYLNNENQIISEAFFLSGVKNPTPSQELNSTIELLNSTDGYTIACNFPARYIYLKNNHYNVPNFNLSQCDNLNKFIKSFHSDNLSLVFTSEYVNSPVSAFGHTMLLFSDNNKSLNIGDAVHFAAKTNKQDGFLNYGYKGFSGKYKGYFIREPFYKKIYAYNTLEQRYMYMYTLDFTKEQIKFLIYHLFELRKATFKYYFLDGNCATQTTDLLNVISGYKRDNKIYYLPIDTLKQYKKNIISTNRFIPLVNKIDLLLQKMTKDDKKLFYQVIKTNQDIDDSYSDIVKEALVDYTTFSFRRFHRWYKNYDNIMGQSYIKRSTKDKSLDPLDKTQASNIGLGIFHKNNTKFLYFHYRPLFIDMFDIQINNMQQSTVDTFMFDLILDTNKIKLQKFDLINIKSFTTQSKFYKPVSWSIYSGLNRYNQDNTLTINNELGIGTTKALFDRVNLSTLLYLGFNNSDIYIKPNLTMNNNISNNFKVGISLQYKQYDNNHYYNNMAFITYKPNDFIYQLKFENDNSQNKNKFLFSIKYNF
jgi:hypothetical protein